MPEELWKEVHNTVQKAGSKLSLRKNKYKKAKGLSEAVKIAEQKREEKGKREKERYIHLNAE